MLTFLFYLLIFIEYANTVELLYTTHNLADHPGHKKSHPQQP